MWAKLLFFSILFSLTNTISFAQSDSINYVNYSPDFKFVDGIYLSFEQVKNNKPIPTSRIASSGTSNINNFFEVIFENESFILFDENGMKKKIKKSDVWGYSKLGAIFIQHNNSFFRIPIIGSIAHFVAVEDVERYSGYDPYSRQYNSSYYDYSRTRGSTTSKELRQFLLDFSTGQIFNYDRESLKVLLMSDSVLYDEFNSLRKRKQKKMLFIFIRRFNERNPLMVVQKEN